MKTQTKLVSLIVVSSALLSAAWAAPKDLSWQPNKALLNQLAPVTAAGQYRIQPPKGYVLQTRPGPSGSAAQAWVGAPRTDGTRSYIMLTTLVPPAGEETKYTLSQVSDKLLAGVQGRRKDWKQAPSESGTVNGMTFVRTYWRATDTATGAAMHGFSYVGQDGKGFVQISSQDVEPHSKTTLQLTEASALTFKKP